MEVSKEVCDIHTRHYETALAQHEETIKSLTECTQKLTYIIASQEDKTKDLDKRLKVIERKPNKILEKIFIAGITAIISVLITYYLTGR